MRKNIPTLAVMLVMALLAPLATAQTHRQSQAFKLHNIFSKDMILQRDKPIKVWGWAKPGSKVAVKLGDEVTETTTAAAGPVEVFGHEDDYKGLGKWEVSFAPREANTEPVTLAAASGGATITLDNVLIGDVWVMSGQSNMAFPLDKTNGRELAKMANNPNLRLFSITGNEQATMQDDIRPEAIDTVSGAWDVSSPESASQFSAIGFVYGFYLQNALDIPVGIIKNARGGASIESMVPVFKFDEDPLAKAHADHKGSTVAKVIDGSLHGKDRSCIAGVANTGDGEEWCGSIFNQANWYAFGRLAWDPRLGADEIAKEWIQMTIPADAPTRATILKMMMGSHEAVVDYSMPLGLNMLCKYEGHYDPSPETRTSFHKADAKGVGFDRTKAGSNYVGQYHPELQAIFNDPDKTPLEVMLWFHHVPWDAKLSSGRPLLEELTFRYNRGVSTVDQMADTWKSLDGNIPPAIHASVMAKLIEEKTFARQWRDECIRYFSGLASPGEDR